MNGILGLGSSYLTNMAAIFYKLDLHVPMVRCRDHSVITSMWSYAPDSPISVKLGGDLVTDCTWLKPLWPLMTYGWGHSHGSQNKWPAKYDRLLITQEPHLWNNTCLGPKTTSYPLMMRFQRGREPRSSLRVAQQWSSTSATLGSEDLVSSTSKCRGCLRYLTTG